MATKAVAWSVIHSWGSSFFAFIISIFLARLLEPEAFGLVAMALVYVSFVSVFVEQGLGSALIQRSNIEREHLNSAFWLSVLASVALAGLSVAIAAPVAAAFREPDLAPVVRWLSLSLIFSGLQSTQKAILQRDLDFGALAKRALAANLIGGAAGISAAAYGLGVWSLVIQMLVAELISTVLLWRVSEWRPGIKVSRKHFGDLFGFSASVFAGNLVSFAHRHSDDLLIGLFLGPVALGYYTVAYGMLGKMITLLVNVIKRVAFPMFSRFQSDPIRMRGGFYTATQLTSFIAFPAFLGVVAVAPEFIVTVYGAKWSASVPVVQVLSLAGIYSAVFSFNNSVMLASGKASWRLWLSLGTTVLSVVGFMIAVRWGIVAVAAAYVISQYLVSPVSIWLLRKLLDFELTVYFRQFAVPFIGSLLMLGSVLVVRSVASATVIVPIQLFLYILTGVVVYSGFVHVAQPEITSDIMDRGGSLWKVVKKRRRNGNS